jgi:uncharacterized membrane protein YidH (DUF202 family)
MNPNIRPAIALVGAILLVFGYLVFNEMVQQAKQWINYTYSRSAIDLSIVAALAIMVIGIFLVILGLLVLYREKRKR